MKSRSPIRELIFHSKNYLTGDIFSKGIGFLALMIYAQLMPTADFGIFSMSSALFLLFSIIYGLGIRGALTRYYFENQVDYNDFLGSNTVLFVVWSFIFTIIILLLGDQISRYLEIPVKLFYLTLFIGFSTAIFEMLLAYFQTKKESKKYSISVVSKSILVFFFGIIITIYTEKDYYYGPILGMTFSWIIGLSIVVFLGVKNIRLTINSQHIKYTLLFSLPIFFHLVSQNILNTFDQIIIKQLLNSYAVGIYSFAYQVSVIQLFITMAILRSWSPMFYENMNQKKYQLIESLIFNKSAIIAVLSIGLMLFSEELLFLFVSERYKSAYPLIPILVSGFFMFYLYTIYVNYSFYLKKTIPVTIITVLTGILNVLLNYYFIPIYGIVAAAWTTLVSYSVLFFLNLIVSNSYKNIVVLKLKIIGLSASLVFLSLVISELINYLSKDFLVNFIVKILYFAFAVVILIRTVKREINLNINLN